MRRLSRTALIGAVTIVTVTGCAAPPEEEAWTIAYQQFEVSTLHEGAEGLVKCLADAGFPGYTAQWDGGVISPFIPEGQRDSAKAAFVQCSVEKNKDVGQPNDSENEALYRLELAAVDCLSERGYTVGEPPSLQRYLDLRGTKEHWSAYATITSQIPTGEKAWRELATSCPDPQWFSSSLPKSNE